MPDREAPQRAFRQMIKQLACPACSLAFSDAAVDWGDAWQEGRIDLLKELRSTERDGPFKVRCEYCGRRSFIDYFTCKASLAGDTGLAA